MPDKSDEMRTKKFSRVARAEFKQTRGMCAETGQVLTGLEHLKQSLRNIILTPHRQRVMLRDYGLDDGYLDQPGNRYQVMKLYSRLAAVISRWEPRLDLTRLSVDVSENGQIDFRFEGHYLGKSVQFGVAS